MPDSVPSRLALSPLQRQRLQDVVQDVLRESLAGGGPRYRWLAKQNDQTAAAFAAAVWSAVESVADAFLDRLSRRDPLDYLPAELVSACFRLLKFRDRIAVSHVSRAWRHAALADCGLWTALKLRYGSGRQCSPEMLEAWLVRSGSLPFNFAHLTYSPLPEPLLGVIIRNMPRMCLLEISHNSEPILQLNAPSLQHLRLGSAALPATWGTMVPRLETLVIDRVTIPEDFQALPALTSLNACLEEGSSAPVLSCVFPRLSKLELAGLTQETVAVLGAPPPSCKSVTLAYAYDRLGETPIDYSPFLEACHDSRLPHLLVTGSGSMIPFLREFTNSTQGNCRVQFHLDYKLLLECEQDGIVRDIQTTGSPHFVREARSFVYMDRLHKLSVSLEMLLGIYELQLPGATFPALHALTLVLSGEEIPSARNLLALGSSADSPWAPVRMPRLHELALETRNLDYRRKEDPGEGMRWVLAELPGLLPSLVEMERPRLGTLKVVLSFNWEVDHFCARQDLAALRGLAEEFYVLDQDAFYHFDEDQGGDGRSDDDSDYME